MSSDTSTTTWGDVNAPRRALFVHGLTSSAGTWHRIAPEIAFHGFYVMAPNLVGHASRNYDPKNLSVQSIAEDLLPLVHRWKTFDLIIGHSLGGLVALALLAYLPNPHPTAVLILDPPLYHSPQVVAAMPAWWREQTAVIHQPEVYKAENPLWSYQDAVWRALGLHLVDPEFPTAFYQCNQNFSFTHLLNDTPSNIKVTILTGDPSRHTACPMELLQPYQHLRALSVDGAAHWVHHDAPGEVYRAVIIALDDVAAFKNQTISSGLPRVLA